MNREKAASDRSMGKYRRFRNKGTISRCKLVLFDALGLLLKPSREANNCITPLPLSRSISMRCHATPRKLIIPLVCNITRLRHLSLARAERNDTSLTTFRSVYQTTGRRVASFNSIFRLNENSVENEIVAFTKVPITVLRDTIHHR